jgi:ATP-binding cassette subfamily B protein RaxB
MDFKLDLSFFSTRHSVPVKLQIRPAECGVVCLHMIYECLTGIGDSEKIRTIKKSGCQGLTFLGLIKCANFMDLIARPVIVGSNEIKNLRLPAIVHLENDHFVVLVKVDRKGLQVHDPAVGKTHIIWGEFLRSFTGYALEIWLDKPVSDTDCRSKITLASFTRNLNGKFSALILMLLISLVLELIALVQPLLVQLALDRLIPSADIGMIVTFGIGFSLLVCAQQTVRIFKDWMLVYWGVLLNVQSRSNLFRHMLNLPTEFFGGRSTGDIVTRFAAVDPIQKVITSSIASFIVDGVMAGIVLCIMFYYHSLLALFSLGSVSLYLGVRYVWYKPLRTKELSKTNAAAIQHSFFLESIRGVKTVQLFSMESARHVQWLKLAERQIKFDVGIQKLHMLYHASIGLILGLENVIVISIGCIAVISGALSGGQLVAFIAYKNIFGARMGAVINSFFEIKLSSVPLERISEVLCEEPMPNYPIDWMLDQPPVLELIDVTFSYSITTSKILSSVNIRIEPGEFVVLVGPSGIGKTTILNLILGLRAPDSGKILLNKRSIWDEREFNLKGIFASVLQDDELFSGTILENISFFDCQVDIEHVKECARIAAIHVDIENMAMQYGTLIGGSGLSLSGGQRQRIMLARALYKRPKILVLDEATSHLDAKNESYIAVGLKKLSITRIVVAHRQETINLADRVIDFSTLSKAY